MFQEHLPIEDHLHPILVTEALVLQEVIVALEARQDLRGITEVPEVHLGHQEAFAAQEAPPDLLVADLVVGLVVEEDNSSN
jgi:hypothetical protein